MNPSALKSRRILTGAILALLLVTCAAGVYLLVPRTQFPSPGSPVYEQYVEAFTTGVAALDADVISVAEERLTKAVALIPEEPAGWANRGLLFLRTERLDEAAADLEKARIAAPDAASIRNLLGLLARRQGRFGDAAGHFRAAVSLNSRDVKSLYLLNEVLEQDNQDGSDAERLKLHEQMLELRPQNIKLLLNRLKLALAGDHDNELVSDTLRRLKAQSTGWAEMAQRQLAVVEKSLAASQKKESMLAVLQFSNVLLTEPDFRRSLSEVTSAETLPGESLATFLKLAPVQPSPAPADFEIRFDAEPIAQHADELWTVIKSVWLTGDSQPKILLANSKELRDAENGISWPSIPATDEGLVAFDINNDGRSDLFLAGTSGMKFYRQQDDGQLIDATSTLGLTTEFLQTAFSTALAADVDHDGDLDVLLSTVSGMPTLLRNNFDGTMSPIQVFTTAIGPQTFACADLDNDGDADIALLDADGRLRVYANERLSEFSEWPADLSDARFAVIVVADVTDDGVMDLVALRTDGHLVAISDQNKRSSWMTKELGHWDVETISRANGPPKLIAADFDNNGVADLLASGSISSMIWLGSGGGNFLPLKAPLPSSIKSTHLTAEGRVDLLGLDQTGHPFRLVNSGTKDYHWQMVRLRAAGGAAAGDNRINSFAIGGTIELKTGTHVVTRPIDAPVTHFGLGRKARTDILRIVWPNGTAQYEFDTPVDQTVAAIQRLKGSCPFLFSWNGQQFDFVTDFMWSTPLGMYINADDKGGFLQTTDWVKIPGQQLAIKDGQYELRVNANLWETHFFDHLALMAVDYPADAHMFVDERFHMRPAEPAYYLTEAPQNVAQAWDHNGQDATAELRSNDGVYLDRAGRGLYQGITRDHWVEIDLGDQVSGKGPCWLIARGWVHPTDSSVNYAIEQGNHARPTALVLEVPDGKGGWKTGMDRLGFPAGKNKTMMIRLDGINGAEVPRRFRLRTSMEIYWDSIRIAQGCDGQPTTQHLLNLQTSELRYRGLVAMTQESPSSPEIPHYDQLATRHQAWRDLIGYYTRFGEISELLQVVDDRYAILNAGDEIILKFSALPDPPDGMKRDFVFIADGWVKDGDFNTRFGKTVLPLPAHDLLDYRQAPGGIETDPVFLRHSDDWLNWHTRLVTPDHFEQGLRMPRRQTNSIQTDN